MTTQRSLSPGLLRAAPAARLAAFEQKIIRHPHLDAVHCALVDAIRSPAGASLILVYGPTGVGKTTLRQRVEKQLIDEAQATMAQQPGYVPVASVAAIAPESGNFNWKDYYIRALIALAEPLLDDKIDYGVRGIRHNGAGRPVVAVDVAAPALRRALERALQHRRPQALLVDEAQHFKKLASGRRLLDQMDILKSLAETTNTVHVLFGTYEVLDLRNLSAQLGRRSRELHLARYRLDRAEERTIFQTILRTFQRALPLRDEPDLVRYDQYCYERSLGCVGILKNWLTRALALALAEDAATLTARHLEQAADPAHTLLQMARELHDGETLLRTLAPPGETLRTLLEAAPSAAATPNAPPASATKRRVGERRPGRDPVGEAQP